MAGNVRSVWSKHYKSKRWRRLRERQLAKYPMCQCPHCKGKKLPANVVDHIKPHRGDTQLLWNPDNLQSMAATCHNAMKQSYEKGGQGFLRGSDENGWPLSHEHEWYERG